MKTAISIYLLAPIFLLFSCKNTEKSTQVTNPKIETSPQVGNPSKNTTIEKKEEIKSEESSTNQNQIPQPENYSLVVSFYSIGSGIDRPVAQEFDYLVKDFQEQFGEDFIAERVSWGREGEVDYCIQLGKLKPTASASFKSRADIILRKTERVHSKENAPCIRRRNK
jgi:hypothetical protein